MRYYILELFIYNFFHYVPVMLNKSSGFSCVHLALKVLSDFIQCQMVIFCQYPFSNPCFIFQNNLLTSWRQLFIFSNDIFVKSRFHYQTYSLLQSSFFRSILYLKITFSAVKKKLTIQRVVGHCLVEINWICSGGM